MPDTATYVYCVVHRDRPITLRSMPAGVRGGSRPAIEPVARGLWIVVSQVALSAYGPGRIERRLADLDWVADLALAHQAVVERLRRVADATVVPMKLFTMFSDLPRARREIGGRASELRRVARRVRGCSEWGIRITGRAGASRQPTGPRPRSGTAFLAARKAARDRAREQAGTVAAVADDVFRELQRVAREAIRRPPPDGASAPPMLDAAFLVADDRADRFKIRVARARVACSKAGLGLTLTGPWPAYHFVAIGEDAS